MVFKLMGCHFGTPEKEPFSEPLFGPASMSPNCGRTSFQDQNQVHIPDPFWGPPSVEGTSGRGRLGFMRLQLYEQGEKQAGATIIESTIIRVTLIV